MVDLAALRRRLAEVLDGRGSIPEVVAACRAAEAAAPGDAAVQRLLVVALLAQAGRRSTLPLDEPGLNFATEAASIAEVLLLLGQFDEGWRRYERRVEIPSYGPERLALPLDSIIADGVRRWRGEPGGRAVLAIGEGGFGDILHFARYVPRLAEHWAETILMVPTAIAALLRAQPALASVRVVTAHQAMAKPDAFVPLMSLPHRLGLPEPTAVSQPWLTAGSFPAPRLAGLPPGGIGLAWRSSRRLPGRELPLDRLAAAVAGRSAVALQPDLRPDEAAILDAAGIRCIPGLDDNGPHAFLDSAALIARLDLVITCDTSIAHLAGSMGRPTWVLLPWNSEWRWLLGRSDSPWYPSLRLFRQPRPGDWAPVLEQVAAALGNGGRT